jgi:hypothetical protein
MLQKLLRLLNIYYITAFIFIILFFSGLMEILKKGSLEILIALVISSFTFTSIPLQLHEKYRKKIKIIYLSKCFIIAGLLMSLGFSLPFIVESNKMFLLFIYLPTLVGIACFVASCILLLLKINEIQNIGKNKSN